MASTISKSASVTIGPAVSAVPAAPAYCAQYILFIGRGEGNRRWSANFYRASRAAYGQRALFAAQQPQYAVFNRVETACVAETVELPATQSTRDYRILPRWTVGDGTSDILVGAGSIEFFNGADSAGMVVGLCESGAIGSVGSYTHAFVFDADGTVSVWESGVYATTLSGIAHVALFRFSRSAGGVITYYVDGVLKYTSAAASSNPALLGALFSADCEPIDSVTVVGSSSGAGITRSGTSETTGPAAVGASADSLTYMASSGVAAGYIGYAVGGEPSLPADASEAVGPAAVGVSFGYATHVDAVATIAAAAVGVSADYAYSSSAGEFRVAPVGFSYDEVVPPGEGFVSEFIAVEDGFALYADATATFISTVDVGDAVDVVLELTTGFEWFDVLLTTDTLTSLADVDAEWMDGAYVTDQTGANQRAGLQYANNMNTNALTSYTGFDFLTLLNTPTGVYGLRADGVYHITGSTDAGATRDAFVDVGARSFGSTAPKNLDAIFFGLTTDGTPMAVIAGDNNVPKAYTVATRSEFMRTDVGKRRLARTWRLRLELYAATQAELDSIEYVVRPATRRWIK